MKALLGIFLFFFIAFVLLLLILIRFLFGMKKRQQQFNSRQRHRRFYTDGSATDAKGGVEVYDTRDPEKRDKKVISDNEGEYVEPIE